MCYGVFFFPHQTFLPPTERAFHYRHNNPGFVPTHGSPKKQAYFFTRPQQIDIQYAGIVAPQQHTLFNGISLKSPRNRHACASSIDSVKFDPSTSATCSPTKTAYLIFLTHNPKINCSLIACFAGNRCAASRLLLQSMYHARIRNLCKHKHPPCHLVLRHLSTTSVAICWALAPVWPCSLWRLLHTRNHVLPSVRLPKNGATPCSQASFTGYRKQLPMALLLPSSICTRKWCRYFVTA